LMLEIYLDFGICFLEFHPLGCFYPLENQSNRKEIHL